MSNTEHLIRTFWNYQASLEKPDATRRLSHTPYDRQILARLCKPNDRVLDLGCGRCELANWLVLEHGAVVHAVDTQPEFLANAAKHANLTIEIGDVRTYEPQGPFDVVICFGVIAHLVDPATRDRLYARVAKSLKPGGVLLVKSQFGMSDAVEVNTFSEAFNHHYYAVYPNVAEEAARLSRLFDVEVLDLYPPELSPYPTTKFRHLLCRLGTSTQPP